jgi:protein MpaA
MTFPFKSRVNLCSQILGYSYQGRPLEICHLTSGSQPVLLLGGVHGDEPEGVYLIEQFVSARLWKVVQEQVALWVLPRMNPDGCSLQQRCNARGVDLNRNMPTQDWTAVVQNPRYPPGLAAGSEIETQILVACLDRLQPCAILSAHSSHTDLCVNFNGPAQQLAEAISRENGYPVKADIGYPTPGSLGTWAGEERGIPTITLEIRKGLTAPQVWEEQSRALLSGLIWIAAQR